MTATQTIETIQRELNKSALEIGNVPEELKSIFCVARDVAQLRDRERRFLQNRALLQNRDPLLGGVDVISIGEARSAQCAELARLEVFHSALEACAELAEARKVLNPLLAEHSVLIGKLQMAQSDQFTAESNAREAIDAATAAAVAAIEKSPAVIKARNLLELLASA
jgi:hypothetical protein